MAYAFVLTRSDYSFGGRRHFVIDVAETEASGTTEFSVDGLPQVGTCTLYKSTITAGTGVPGTTVDPIARTLTGAAGVTQADVWANGTAAAHVNNDASSVFHYAVAAGKLFFRTVCSADSDNTVATRIVIVAGHS